MPEIAISDESPTDAEFEEIADFIEKMMQWAFNVTGLRRPTKILMIGTMVSELRAIKAAAIQAERTRADAAEARVRELEQSIPVGERLPSSRKRVLVFDMTWQEGWYNADEGHWHTKGYRAYNVTHWRELPAPPE